MDDGTDPPPDAELLTLSQTVTVTAVDTLRVVTDLFVRRRE